MALQGIDISSWQSGINLAKVKADFVIVKATEGSKPMNNYFTEQIKGAKTSGKLIGAYHYANGLDYKKEADAFIKVVKPYIGECLLALDWEAQGNKYYNRAGDIAWCKNFLDYVYKQTGVRPLLYCTRDIQRKFGNIGNYGYWIAAYASSEATGYQDHPAYESTYPCAIRQYASTGRLSGYSGNLDLNKFYGDRDAWLKYCRSAKKADTTKKTTSASKVTTNTTKTNTSKSKGTVIKKGDKVKVTKAVTYDGKSFKSYYKQYDVIEVSGDRVVIGIGKVVTAAVNSKNLKKV